jgi:arginyl-tRNA synthetase
MMKQSLQHLLRTALETMLAGTDVAVPETILIEPTKDEKNGDFATNLAMTLARPLRKPPRAVAEAIVAALPSNALVSKVEIAGPGFINFFLAPAAFLSLVRDILAAGERYGRDDSGTAGKVLVEFVSANPTGPMHVGHGRGAAYGDALANLLAATGREVFREYYINDAGRQVDILAVSVWIRAIEAGGIAVPFPSRGYPADYIRVTARKLRSAFDPALLTIDPAQLATLPADPVIEPSATASERDLLKNQQERYLDALIVLAKTRLGAQFDALKRLALDDQLAVIRDTLAAFNVRFDRWASEAATVDSGAVKTAVAKLSAAGHVYEQDGATWLRTSTFGDEKDRVLVKADGAATYFVNDIAYHIDKLDRGWPRLIDVWGADHHGYIPRMRGAIEALTGRTDALDVQLIQFVTLSSGKMGKRSGNFVTLRDLIDEVGTDATRFFYLSRSHDQHLEFDLELARSQSNDNPVFYVQYAHARVAAVFRQAAERGLAFDTAAVDASLPRLSEPHEKALLGVLAKYPETLRNAANLAAPHILAFYLRELADALHRWYGSCAFLVDDAELRTARLALAKAAQQVLRNGLGLLGVSAPERMPEKPIETPAGASA